MSEIIGNSQTTENENQENQNSLNTLEFCQLLLIEENVDFRYCDQWHDGLLQNGFCIGKVNGVIQKKNNFNDLGEVEALVDMFSIIEVGFGKWFLIDKVETKQNGKRCSNCKAFRPVANADDRAVGFCLLTDGEIYPDGKTYLRGINIPDEEVCEKHI